MIKPQTWYHMSELFDSLIDSYVFTGVESQLNNNISPVPLDFEYILQDKMLKINET